MRAQNWWDGQSLSADNMRSIDALIENRFLPIPPVKVPTVVHCEEEVIKLNRSESNDHVVKAVVGSGQFIFSEGIFDLRDMPPAKRTASIDVTSIRPGTIKVWLTMNKARTLKDEFSKILEDESADNDIKGPEYESYDIDVKFSEKNVAGGLLVGHVRLGQENIEIAPGFVPRSVFLGSLPTIATALHERLSPIFERVDSVCSKTVVSGQGVDPRELDCTLALIRVAASIKTELCREDARLATVALAINQRLVELENAFAVLGVQLKNTKDNTIAHKKLEAFLEEGGYIEDIFDVREFADAPLLSTIKNEQTQDADKKTASAKITTVQHEGWSEYTAEFEHSPSVILGPQTEKILIEIHFQDASNGTKEEKPPKAIGIDSDSGPGHVSEDYKVALHGNDELVKTCILYKTGVIAKGPFEKVMESSVFRFVAIGLNRKAERLMITEVKER